MHAAATEVRREFGLEPAQVILGHSQANVTQVDAERDLAKRIDVDVTVVRSRGSSWADKRLHWYQALGDIIPTRTIESCAGAP